MVARRKQGRAAEPKTHEEDALLTITEVARQLGKHPSTVARWCSDGWFTAVRMGPEQHWAIRKSEVNKVLLASAMDKQVTDPVCTDPVCTEQVK